MKGNKDAKISLASKNVLYGFGSKLIILVLGIVVPRIVIVSYGSEINGFLSTITQIFTYFALLEAGIGSSAVNALFSPLEKQDYNQANVVVGQARSYYRKATIAYTIIVVAFAFVYPFLMPSELDKVLMIKVILLQGAPHAISYYFCAVYEQLLMADGKRYISENIQLVLHILTSASKIILILCGFDIVAVQLTFFVMLLAKIPVVVFYCRYKYPWLSFDLKGETICTSTGPTSSWFCPVFYSLSGPAPVSIPRSKNMPNSFPAGALPEPRLRNGCCGKTVFPVCALSG